MRYVIFIVVIVVAVFAFTEPSDDFGDRAKNSAATLENIADHLEETGDIKQTALLLRAEAHHLRVNHRIR